jgi:hypothetical protein
VQGVQSSVPSATITLIPDGTEITILTVTVTNFNFLSGGIFLDIAQNRVRTALPTHQLPSP